LRRGQGAGKKTTHGKKNFKRGKGVISHHIGEHVRESFWQGTKSVMFGVMRGKIRGKGLGGGSEKSK